MHNDLANTEAQTKQNQINGSGDTVIQKERGMLSNIHNHIFVVYK
jgi:hypothetical protein